MTARRDPAPAAGGPAPLRDRTAEAVAVRRREIERGLAELVTPEMLAEHRRLPVGCHSPALSWVLAYFRQLPTGGKLVVQSSPVVDPGAPGAWGPGDRAGTAGAGGEARLQILRLSGRPGVAHEVMDGSFGSEDEALDAVFRRRLAEYGMAGHGGPPAPAPAPGPTAAPGPTGEPAGA